MLLIENLLQEGNIDTLPSVRELSSRCGVSVSTVWKEISLLQKEGKLQTRWGHEVKVVKKGTMSCGGNVKEAKRPKWQLIRDKISNDFLNGHYQATAPLPTTKELQHRYSVSYPTILKALGSLQSAGDIEQSGKRYQIARSQTTVRWKSKIVLISAGTPFGEPKITSEREREFYQFLSLEALRAQVDLEQIFYEDWGEKPFFYTPDCQQTNLSDKDNVLGYILSSWHTKDYTV
ncbi:MAG: GntR family transcriptional regulator, partial [Fibrobacter sp.]|nr:GntR family transcriptional regulator [Fibrobacter sp.]